MIIEFFPNRFNLTDKEGSADRKVPVQPLAFTNKEGTISRYNLRKVIKISEDLRAGQKSIIRYNFSQYSSASCLIIWFDRDASRICTRTFCSTTTGYTQSYLVVRCKRYWLISRMPRATLTKKTLSVS